MQKEIIQRGESFCLRYRELMQKYPCYIDEACHRMKKRLWVDATLYFQFQSHFQTQNINNVEKMTKTDQLNLSCRFGKIPASGLQNIVLTVCIHLYASANILFCGYPPGPRPSLYRFLSDHCASSVDTYFAHRDISSVIRRISMKIDTNIHQVSGNCGKHFLARMSKVRVTTKPKAIGLMVEACISNVWHRGSPAHLFLRNLR